MATPNLHQGGAADACLRPQSARRDDRVVVTRTGLVVECRKCGRVLAVQATPAHKTVRPAGRAAA